jgi:SAM-dependent methyltransferase
MKTLATITLDNVKAVYSGAEGALWELIMGEQIHIGGMASSNALADAAGLAQGLHGVDLCCCSGAGMRFLVRFRGAASMRGIDATPRSIANCRTRCEAEGSADRIEGILADACSTGLPSASADFVWGEDAWCYVADKPALVAEAARVVKPGGTIAFTDWVEGEGLSDAEAHRFMTFMKFPSMASIADYARLLADNGCEVRAAENTGQFARHIDLYLDMLSMQLTYDALRIIGFDAPLMNALAAEMAFARDLAHAGKIAQGRFVAVRR